MTDSLTHDRPARKGLAAAALAGACCVVIAALVWTLFLRAPQEPAPYEVAGFEPMTADALAEEFFLVAPELLTVVYRAFNETGEAEIYDSLATVAAGDALQELYLERVGAMVGGGLDPSEEADQQIHTMEMLRIDQSREGERFTWNARWRVVGTVGHATHMHVRGNTYAAILTVEPVEGAWRVTGFDLTDVDRSEAGEMVAAEP
ncbi:hypothetical protein KUL25_01245 [Rhodobacteraceae bacterium N5(2021)]|uniref:Uncharacterized protein n=1 Tax=Gymnodinialimonas phycosphaerae TaxID=2841589 RepID=A0A975YG66_9RHOB|nr:hypothetical protein [Gymnodinialimonas phycosphaerae]MBY4891383.1 hypothetical protein [Gymnodinialimonas phycosphaerae]